MPARPASFKTTLFRYPGPGGWTFARIPARRAPPPSHPWGRAPVTATVDGQSWDTSVWHDRKHGPLLPIPKRLRGDKGDGDVVELTLVSRLAPGRSRRRRGVASILAFALVALTATLGRADELPRQLMHQLPWSFVEPTQPTQAAFERAVSEYQRQIGTPPWRPEAVLLPVGEIEVVYVRWAPRGKKPLRIRVRAPDGEPRLTTGAILFQIHAVAHDWFAGMDHHFFEGIDLVPSSATGKGRVPVYELVVGS